MTSSGSAALGGEEASGTGAAAGAATGAGATGAGVAYESEQRARQRQRQDGIKLLSNLNDCIYQKKLYVQGKNAFLMHCYSACSKRLTDMQRSSRRRSQASLHLNCVSTSLKRAPFGSAGLVCMCMWTPAPCKKKFPISWGLLHSSRKKGRENSDAVKIKQLNSPLTMSPAGAGSGKGEGPRETAGRSNLPTQARGSTRERRKPWRAGSKEKY